ncbi:hypothetical protein HHL24_00175 [Paraburkholderia sp. RP-4-7]|uniref:Uncharacterized protein n=1 Tax=Paraburkholderia polaris TaxID=2728848 RepID=A0A848IA58_9BURK|nr:hypothetical protein [Paraburkholderia polaris]NML96383.1 hypothetical protein [Paraburkholderia polaris]
MKTSITHAPDKGALRARRLSAVGLTLAIACLFTTSPLRAESDHHEGQQHSQGHAAPRQAYGHDDHRHGHDNGNQGYYGNQSYYGAPPVVYAPQAAPGISLFLPL